jgi:sortase A
MLRTLRVGGWTLVWSGLIILGYVGYQLYGTDLVAAQDQRQARQALAGVLDVRRSELPDPVAPVVEEQPEVEEEGAAAPAPVLREELPPAEGEALGVIRIPAIEVDDVVFEGVDTETLKLGPGRIPYTAFPGQPGNAVISGHRTTYGRPFFDLDLLVAGDLIEVETALGVHQYTVRSIEIVEPTDVWVTETRDGAWLTLTTCHPRWSARQRLVVFAELTAGPNHEFVSAS